jgi:hypothetical protein
MHARGQQLCRLGGGYEKRDNRSDVVILEVPHCRRSPAVRRLHAAADDVNHIRRRRLEGAIEERRWITLPRHVQEGDFPLQLIRITVRLGMDDENLARRGSMLQHRNERILTCVSAARARNNNRETRHDNLP